MQWVLSRPLCRFHCFDLKDVPKARRAQALQLQIQQRSPFAATGQYVVWGRDDASVWIWDADHLVADLQAEKLPPRRVTVIPETLLHPAAASGSRLVSCLDGVEGQIWQGGFLSCSRWWPDVPSEADWLNFQRDAGIAPQEQRAAIPPPLAQPWIARPWARSAHAARGANQTLPYETWLVGSVLLLMSGYTSWYGIQLAKAHEAIAQRKNELKLAEENARPMLAARQQALDALARIQALQAANLYPDTLALMAQVAKRMTKEGAYLKEWDYQNGKLKFTMASTNKLSSSFVVKELQNSGWFSGVQALPSNDPTSLTLTMETLPSGEIKEETETVAGLTPQAGKRENPMNPTQPPQHIAP